MTREEIQVRLDVVYANDIRGVLSQNGDNIRNPAVEYNRILDDLDEAKLIELESSKLTFESKLNKVQSRKAKKNNGNKARRACQGVLDLIAGYNMERSLTTSQINTLKVTFKNAKDYLFDSQPWAAKAEIEAITPDNVLVTQDMKDDILDEFSESGLPGL